MSDKFKYRLLLSTLEIMVIFFSFGLVNVNSFIRFRQFPEVDNYSDNEGAYIFVAIFVVILIVFSLSRNQLFVTYLATWKKNRSLMVLLGYALISVLWTVYFPATLYKLIFLSFFQHCRFVYCDSLQDTGRNKYTHLGCGNLFTTKHNDRCVLPTGWGDAESAIPRLMDGDFLAPESCR